MKPKKSIVKHVIIKSSKVKKIISKAEKEVTFHTQGKPHKTISRFLTRKPCRLERSRGDIFRLLKEK